MGWADDYILRLQTYQTVQFRPSGRSMEPRIKSGQLVTVKPWHMALPAVGDVVLCKVRGRQYLHIIKAIAGLYPDASYQIGNAKGSINGWTTKDKIYGVCVKVED